LKNLLGFSSKQHTARKSGTQPLATVGNKLKNSNAIPTSPDASFA
jgi:hypothetical protein